MEIKRILKPTRGLHDGSSFREILDIWKENGVCEVVDNISPSDRYSGDETQWIESRPWINNVGDILLYDQPILDKLNPTLKWDLALFSNEVKSGKDCRSWTFWPNHPKEHEKVRKEGILSYDERAIESCFIGSHTTGHRNNYNIWQSSIEFFWMGGMNQRLMSQNEYLNKLKISKFGLCLRGVGPKCLRDVELIGLGTVPIFTSGVSTDYYNKLEENKHFLYAETPSEAIDKIKNCTKEKWEYMSNECIKWFEENSSPIGVFNLTQKIINEFYG